MHKNIYTYIHVHRYIDTYTHVHRYKDTCIFHGEDKNRRKALHTSKQNGYNTNFSIFTSAAVTEAPASGYGSPMDKRQGVLDTEACMYKGGSISTPRSASTDTRIPLELASNSCKIRQSIEAGDFGTLCRLKSVPATRLIMLNS